MKKYGVILMLVIVITLFSSNMVLAQYPIIEDFITQTGEAFKSIFRPILGGNTPDNLLFAKISFFFIIFLIVYVALRNVDVFGSNNAAHFIVTLVVSVLSARYIPDIGIIETLILPYVSVFVGIALIAAPISILIALHNSSVPKYVRKMILFLLAIVYLFFWIGGVFGAVDPSIGLWNSLSYNNWLASMPFIILFLSAIFDGSIERGMQNQRIAGAIDEQRQRSMQRWLEELHRAENNNDEQRVKRVRSVLRRKYGVHT